MSAAEIEQTKTNLVAWIEQLSDTATLTFLEGLKDSKSTGDWWEHMSESKRQHINEGLHDIENGQTMLSADFWKKLKNA